jgi:glyoxylate reductase
MASRPRVVVTRPLPPPIEARLVERFGAELAAAPLAPGRLPEAMRRCEILVATVGDRIDAAAIGQAGGGLKLIANFGVGVDHIDLDAARAAGIAVTNTPDVLTGDTADIVIALILMLLRRLGEGERAVRSGAWGGWKPAGFLGRALGGKTLAIVGMGRIGRAVAVRAAAFGMNILYHNRRRLPEAVERGAAWRAKLDALVAEADILSLNAPYGPETHHLIDRRRLALMKRDSVLINAARGNLVDQDALIEALEAGAIAGAGLDVYPNEPEVDPRLIALGNVVLLPHLGSATVETRIAMGEKVIDNVAAWVAGRTLPDRVV